MAVTLPGFADPVLDAQACFRALLDAMARPGSIHRAGAALIAPAPLCPAAAAVLLALVDGESSVFIDPAFAEAADWVRFHCGVAPTADQTTAAFVLASSLPDLASLACGSDEGPEDAATVILQVSAFGEGPSFTLAGPGLQCPTDLRVTGLPADFAARWADNHRLFPRGIDLILCAGDRLVALPRSVTIAPRSVAITES